MEKGKDKSKLMTYGMYAGLGLLAGAVAYYLYNWVSSSMKVAALAPAGGASHNAMGHYNAMGKASWDCLRHPEHPGCDQSMAKAASWDCLRHPDHPGCDKSVMAKASWDCLRHPEHPGCDKSAKSNKVMASTWG